MSGLISRAHIPNRAVHSDDPVLGKDAVGRRAVDDVLVVRLQPLWVMQHRIGEPQLLCVGRQLGQLVIGADGPDDDARLLVETPERCFDVRDLGRADRSPGREVAQDDRTSALLREGPRTPVQILQREVRRQISDADV